MYKCNFDNIRYEFLNGEQEIQQSQLPEVSPVEDGMVQHSSDVAVVSRDPHTTSVSAFVVNFTPETYGVCKTTNVLPFDSYSPGGESQSYYTPQQTYGPQHESTSGFVPQPILQDHNYNVVQSDVYDLIQNYNEPSREEHAEKNGHSWNNPESVYSEQQQQSTPLQQYGNICVLQHESEQGGYVAQQCWSVVQQNPNYNVAQLDMYDSIQNYNEPSREVHAERSGHCWNNQEPVYPEQQQQSIPLQQYHNVRLLQQDLSQSDYAPQDGCSLAQQDHNYNVAQPSLMDLIHDYNELSQEVPAERNGHSLINQEAVFPEPQQQSLSLLESAATDEFIPTNNQDPMYAEQQQQILPSPEETATDVFILLNNQDPMNAEQQQQSLPLPEIAATDMFIPIKIDVIGYVDQQTAPQGSTQQTKRRYTAKVTKKLKTFTSEWNCAVCVRSFKSKGGLSQHNLTAHSGPKPHGCVICGKRFKDFKTMQEHHQRHLATDKPFKCTECPKQFFRSSDLQRHTDLHHGMAQYSCQFCGKAFDRPDHVKDHELSHENGTVKRRKLMN